MKAKVEKDTVLPRGPNKGDRLWELYAPGPICKMVSSSAFSSSQKDVKGIKERDAFIMTFQ